MFRPVTAVAPGLPELRSAFLAPRPTPLSPIAPKPLDEHLAKGRAQKDAARVLLPTDLAFAAQNEAIRITREIARKLLQTMPTQASPRDVAAAVKVMQAISAYNLAAGASANPPAHNIDLLA